MYQGFFRDLQSIMGKLDYRTLRENVADEIRMKILNGDMKPGDKIIEQELASEFGISRGPVREALRQLEAHPELVTRLQENALYMRSLLNERNIKMRPSNGNRIPIIPIYTYEPIPTLTIAKELYERGVYVNSSLPPAAAPHECLLRTSLMATHTHALIDEAVGIMKDVLRRHDL